MDAFADPQTGVAPRLARSRNVRSRCRCSMCPAIHINSRSWLRSSSTHEPSDPPPKVVLSVSAAGREGLSGPCHRRVPHFLSFRSFGVCQQKGIAKAVPPRGPGKNDWRGDRVVLVPRRTWELDSLNRRLSGPPGRELASRGHLSPPKLAGHEDRQADQSRSGETELPPPVSSSTRRRPESEVPRRWDCATRAGGVWKEGGQGRPTTTTTTTTNPLSSMPDRVGERDGRLSLGPGFVPHPKGAAPSFFFHPCYPCAMGSPGLKPEELQDR